jgi:arsenite-transporting ATPase
MRLIVYMGKGGVGKTTLAAATALASAARGCRTLVLSADGIPTLAQVFDTTLAEEPCQVAPSLWAQEINPKAEWRQQQKMLLPQLAQLNGDSGIVGQVLDNPAVLPGIDSLLILFSLHKHLKEGRFERIIVDAPGLSETLRLLTGLDSFCRYIERLIPADDSGRQWLQTLASGLRRPSANLFRILSELEGAATEMQGSLQNPELTSYRVVMRPQRIPIQTAQRVCAVLSLFGYAVDGVIINGILPEAEDDHSITAQHRALQVPHLQTIERAFPPFPVWRAPWVGNEAIGLPALSLLAHACFGVMDPGVIAYRHILEEITEQATHALLRISLPFVAKKELRVRKRAERLSISVGGFQREIFLPSALAQRRAGEGRLVDGMLEILFHGK